MATKVQTVEMPKFKPFTAAEKAGMKKLDKAMHVITQFSGRDIQVKDLRDQQRKFEQDEANAKALAEARKLLLKSFDEQTIKDCKSAFQANYNYVHGIVRKSRGKGAAQPSMSRKVHMLTELVAKHCGIDYDVMASTDAANGEARKKAANNATMTLLRMLPPKKNPPEKPSEACSNFGARLAQMKGFEKIDPQSMTDANFKKAMEWILQGWQAQREKEREDKRYEDAKAAVANAKTDRAKKIAQEHLDEIKKERDEARKAAMAS